MHTHTHTHTPGLAPISIDSQLRNGRGGVLPQASVVNTSKNSKAARQYSSTYSIRMLECTHVCVCAYVYGVLAQATVVNTSKPVKQYVQQQNAECAHTYVGVCVCVPNAAHARLQELEGCESERKSE